MSPKQTTQQALEGALRRLLKPLVRILLRNSISYGLFSEVAKRVYVEVATEEFAIPGKAQTTSRVATLTGLTRKEVQRINALPEEESELHSSRYNRAARVVTAWATEAPFVDERGAPRPLPFNDTTGPSFTALVKRASGDITPRTILDELIHVGAVKALPDGHLQLMTRAYIPHGDDVEKITILGTDVADLIATIDHNLRCGEQQRARFQRKVCYDNLPVEVMEALRDTLAGQAQEALERMNAEMSRCDRDTNPKLKGHGRIRAGLGIYYFEHDAERDGKE